MSHLPPAFLSVLLLTALILPVPAGAETTRAITIAVLGDSLTAGYGLPAGQAFPARLEAALRRGGLPVRVINGGVSGDTTAGGLARVDWLLADRPDLVIVELGANDALRGLDPGQAEANLDAILVRVRQSGARVLLAGMLAPRNLGKEYGQRFDGIYPRLAAKHKVPLYPFFLEGVAGKPEFNLGDGIHPNAQGVEEIVRRILPQVRAMAEELLALGKGT